ncbi:shewanella-like protein phosphatase 2 [Quercus suber]|uniref:Shewanella-like protein phosphatase 2 n=1 Tax=Quercus suber TaxID=58331 RepID=A0AAW0M8J9_QUESU
MLLQHCDYLKIWIPVSVVSGSATVQENGSWTSCFELCLFGVKQVLAITLGANRMTIFLFCWGGGLVVHAIQEIGINGVCNNQAIWIDVGMLKGSSNGLPDVCAISGNSEFRILTSIQLYQNKLVLHTEKKEGFLAQGPKPFIGSEGLKSLGNLNFYK